MRRPRVRRQDLAWRTGFGPGAAAGGAVEAVRLLGWPAPVKASALRCGDRTRSRPTLRPRVRWHRPRARPGLRSRRRSGAAASRSRPAGHVDVAEGASAPDAASRRPCRPHDVESAAVGCGASAPGSSRQRDITRRAPGSCAANGFGRAWRQGPRDTPEGTPSAGAVRQACLSRGVERPVPPAQVAGDERESGRSISNATAADSGLRPVSRGWSVSGGEAGMR